MSDFNQIRALDRLPKVSVIRLREEVGGRIGGLRSGSGFAADLTFNANVHPTTPAQMRMLTAGEEVHGAITIYTDKDLRTSKTRGQNADRLDVRGQRYKVVKELDWIGQGFRIFIAGTEAETT